MLDSAPMEWLSDPNIWLGLITLTILEIVLGIDNIVFISILSGKLPQDQRPRARRVGLALALIMRVLLLLSISWVMGLTAPLLTIVGREITGRDLILFLGGGFLIFKSVREIHEKLEGEPGHALPSTGATFGSVIFQIMLLDLVFSLDSVITAVGMVQSVAIMVAAVLIAVAFMLVFVNPISDFVEKHPTVKMLALAFLILIGVNLIAEATGNHIPKGYTYFAMAFSVVVELLNLRMKAKAAPVHLRSPMEEG